MAGPAEGEERGKPIELTPDKVEDLNRRVSEALTFAKQLEEEKPEDANDGLVPIE